MRTRSGANVSRASRAPSAGIAPYAGLGTWVDVYDWSLTFGKDGPLVEPATVDLMAERGVQTLSGRPVAGNIVRRMNEEVHTAVGEERFHHRGHQGHVVGALEAALEPTQDRGRVGIPEVGHHHPDGENLPPAFSVINPKQHGDPYPDRAGRGRPRSAPLS